MFLFSDKFVSRPYFGDTETVITVQQGEAAFFNCQVFNLANQTVSCHHSPPPNPPNHSTPNFYPKYEIKAIEKLWDNPFPFHCCLYQHDQSWCRPLKAKWSIAIDQENLCCRPPTPQSNPPAIVLTIVWLFPSLCFFKCKITCLFSPHGKFSWTETFL